MKTLILGSGEHSLTEDGLHHLDYVRMMLPITEVIVEAGPGVALSAYRWARYNGVPVKKVNGFVGERYDAAVMFVGAPPLPFVNSKRTVNLRLHEQFVRSTKYEQSQVQTGRRTVGNERRGIPQAQRMR